MVLLSENMFSSWSPSWRFTGIIPNLTVFGGTKFELPDPGLSVWQVCLNMRSTSV